MDICQRMDEMERRVTDLAKDIGLLVVKANESVLTINRNIVEICRIKQGLRIGSDPLGTSYEHPEVEPEIRASKRDPSFVPIE